jgi:hypothetical protein
LPATEPFTSSKEAAKPFVSRRLFEHLTANQTHRRRDNDFARNGLNHGTNRHLQTKAHPNTPPIKLEKTSRPNHGNSRILTLFNKSGAWHPRFRGC